MTKPLMFLPPAAADTLQAARWYNSQVPLLGRAFLAELHQQVGRIHRFPESYPQINAACRRANLHRFPYAIIYRVLPVIIEVVAVLHCNVHPDTLYQLASDPEESASH